MLDDEGGMRPGPADFLSFSFVFIDILALFPEFHAVDEERFANRPFHCVAPMDPPSPPLHCPTF
ncbi:hypothetical protein SBA2_20026 [Acidobacteriia bacterium SbA2]|nr:hypothetical protein SBA2_20026 [Acidobacteriia bacterium SbA2]